VIRSVSFLQPSVSMSKHSMLKEYQHQRIRPCDMCTDFDVVFYIPMVLNQNTMDIHGTL